MADQAVTPPTPNAPPSSVATPRPGHSHVGVDVRIRIIESAITVFRVHTFRDASFALVAGVAAMPEADIREHFATWDGLVTATIDLWSGRRTGRLQPVKDSYGAVAYLRGLVQSNIADPALMRFMSALVNIAGTPRHPMSEFLQHTWLRFHAAVRNQLAEDIAAGREPDTMQPARGAEQLIALYEGLQLQSMVRPGMDLLDSYDRAITRLRDGWTQTYTPPVWDIDHN